MNPYFVGGAILVVVVLIVIAWFAGSVVSVNNGSILVIQPMNDADIEPIKKILPKSAQIITQNDVQGKPVRVISYELPYNAFMSFNVTGVAGGVLWKVMGEKPQTRTLLPGFVIYFVTN